MKRSYKGGGDPKKKQSGSTGTKVTKKSVENRIKALLAPGSKAKKMGSMGRVAAGAVAGATVDPKRGTIKLGTSPVMKATPRQLKGAAAKKKLDKVAKSTGAKKRS